MIEIGFRAPPGARAFVVLPDGLRVQLTEQGGTTMAAPGDEFRADLTTQQRAAASVRYSGLVRVEGAVVTPDTGVARPAIGSLQPGVRITYESVAGEPPLGLERVEIVGAADRNHTRARNRKSRLSSAPTGQMSIVLPENLVSNGGSDAVPKMGVPLPCMSQVQARPVRPRLDSSEQAELHLHDTPWKNLVPPLTRRFNSG